jgi:hypothetical protein
MVWINPALKRPFSVNHGEGVKILSDRKPFYLDEFIYPSDSFHDRRGIFKNILFDDVGRLPSQTAAKNKNET